MRGSTNKSSIKLNMQRKLNFTMIVYEWGKLPYTNPENPLLSKQAVTIKRISVPYTNLQLNHYPNTQLDLFCNNNISFSMYDSQYVTNQ